MRLAAIAAATLLASSAGAHDRGEPSGDGRPTTESRTVEPFREIRLESSADVVVKVGAGPAVRVTVDGNLQPYVRTEVRDGVLVIGGDDRGIRPQRDVRVEVEVPELRRCAVVGSGDVAIDGDAGDLALELRGSGELRWRGEAGRLRASIKGSGTQRLEGRAGALWAEVSGSGDLDARRLAATSVEASVEGSGDIDVNVAGGELQASVAGSGSVRWTGSASVARTKVRGSGEISRRD